MPKSRNCVCFICGTWIRDHGDSEQWGQKFRILYSVYSDGASTLLPDAHISGAGINVDNSWHVSLDEHVSWDDDRSIPQESNRVAVLRETPVEGRYGFVLHDECWQLLQAALDPKPVPLGRLFNLCESLPIPRGWIVLFWGHDYGGLFTLDAQPHIPGGGHMLEERVAPSPWWQMYCDPYDVPEVSQQLVRRRDETKSRVLSTSSESQDSFARMLMEIHEAIVAEDPCTDGFMCEATTASGDRQDCFSRIPFEIREAIAAVTPTRDALSLGMASRLFTEIVTSRMFWVSRFAPGRERDYIFEGRKCKQDTDLKKLYQSTGGHRALADAMPNRIRIWKLICYIQNLLELCSESEKGRTARTRQFQDLEDLKWRWKQVSGDVAEERGASYPHSFFDGCRVLGEARAVVPPSLSRIAVSVIQVGEVTYVTGLRLISAEDGNQQLGFRAEAKEKFFAVTADALGGFSVAVGQRGIRALQVVCRDGTKSQWFGCSVNTPITERLLCATQIMALGVGFDGYKLVRLWVAELPADPALPVPSPNPLDTPMTDL